MGYAAAGRGTETAGSVREAAADRRIGLARDEHLAGRLVHRDAMSDLDATGAADEAEIVDTAAVRLHLADEGVGTNGYAACRVGQHGACRDGRNMLAVAQAFDAVGSGDVRGAGGIECNRIAEVVAVAADEARIHERGAGRVELGNEHVAAVARAVAIGGVVCAREVTVADLRVVREVGRVRVAGHVRVAARIDGDAIGHVVVAAAQIRDVGHRAAGAQFGDERVDAAAKRGLRSARRGERAGGQRAARDVDVAAWIDGDRVEFVEPTRAEESDNHVDGRIDDEFARRVVGA